MPEQSSGKWWQALVAVVCIGIASYFIYLAIRSPAINVPEINMSREEVMKAAMPEGPPPSEQVNRNPKEPRTATPKKGGSTPTP